MFFEGGKMKQKNITTQEWITVEKINENGTVKLKNGKMIKILKITPILI